MADAAAAPAMPVATIVRAPTFNQMPPARVRAMFKKLDTNADGLLSLEELLTGFEKEFAAEGLAPHAKDAITSLFEAHATPDMSAIPPPLRVEPISRCIVPCLASGPKALRINVFSRFYAEILFRHFDTNNSGTLQADQAQRALTYLRKRTDGGAAPAVAVALPAGEVNMPFSWFWAEYRQME
jgi:hypothetical protein